MADNYTFLVDPFTTYTFGHSISLERKSNQAIDLSVKIFFLLTAGCSWLTTDGPVQATVKSTGKSVHLVWLGSYSHTLK